MSRLRIANVTIHAGRPDSVPVNGDVVVEDERIVSVGAAAGDVGATVDGAGRHLIPGLIDCHVHLFLNGGATPVEDFLRAGEVQKVRWAVENAARCVATGVTTVRDLGAPRDLMRRFRALIRRGGTPGPRIIAATANITIVKGHGWFLGVEAETPAALRDAVRDNIDAGAEVIKIMASGGVLTAGSDPSAAQYSVESLKAVVDVARTRGLATAAHAIGLGGIRNAVDAGITSIEHGTFLDAPTALRMVAQGTWMVPTVACVQFYLDNLGHPGFAAETRAKVEALRPIRFNGIRLAIASDVRIAAGTDAGVIFTPASAASLAKEVAMYVEQGLSPAKALAAATGAAAELLGVADQVGTIEPGKLADLVLLPGDPLVDPLALGRAELVWQSGLVVGGSRAPSHS